MELFDCMVQVSPFYENRGPRACYGCHRLQKEYRNATTCQCCAQEGHSNCKIGEPKCYNCGAEHSADSKRCPEYRKQQEREINLRRHDSYTRHSSSKPAQELRSSGCCIKRPRHRGLRCHNYTGTTLLRDRRKHSDHRSWT